MPLATLSIDLEARIASLQQGFDRATRQAETSAAAIDAKFSGLEKTARTVGAAFAGAFSVDLLVGKFRSVVDGVDALNDLRDATGATIENLSALEDVALRTGTSVDTMGSALVRFNDELIKARPGSEQAAIFRQIGVDAERLKGIDPSEALRQTAEALAKFADDGDKARVVQALFGKSTKEVAAFLKDLGEAGKLNATVTTEQAEAAERFNKSLAALAKNAEDLWRSALTPVLETLQRLGDAFSTTGRYSEEMSGQARALAVPLQALAVLGANVAFVFKGVGTEIGGIVAQWSAMGEAGGIFSAEGRRAWSAVGRQMKEDAAARRKDLDDFEARILGSNTLPAASYSNEGRAAGARRGIGRLPVVTAPGKVAEFKAFSQPIDDLTASVVKLIQDSDANKLAGLRLQLQALIELRPEGGSEGVDQALARVVEEMAQIDPAARAAAESKKHLDEILAGTPTFELKGVLGDIELINDAYDRGAISAELWAEAARKITGRLPKDTEKAVDEMSEQMKQFQRNVQDVLGSNLGDILKGNFSDIGSAWKNLLADMAAQAIAADIAGRLFGDKGKGGSNAGWWGALMSWIGFAKGVAFDGGGRSLYAFADGGVLTRATPFMFGGGRLGVAGEAGPEAVLPLKRGANGQLGVAGGGGITVNVAAGPSRNEVTSAIQIAMQALRGEFNQKLRRIGAA